jgi:hypothetical protein
MKYIIATAAFSILVGCGGGGTNSSSESQQKLNSPLEKYAGNYGSCDGNHAYDLITNQINHDSTLTITPKTYYYDKADCTGEIKATETWSAGLQTKYKSTQEVGVYGVVFMGERRLVDQVTASAENISLSLSGPGVTNNCVAYTGGNYCLDGTAISFKTNDLAMYINETTKDFVLLAKDGNDYVLIIKAKRI